MRNPEYNEGFGLQSVPVPQLLLLDIGLLIFVIIILFFIFLTLCTKMCLWRKRNKKIKSE